MIWTGNRVKALRKRLGITQEGLARAIGTTAPIVSRWETGRCQPQHFRLIAGLERLRKRE